MSAEILSKLSAYFPSNDICWLADSKSPDLRQARAVPYLRRHAIQKRLDEVMGPGGWKLEYRPGAVSNSVLCALSLKIEGEWVTREDVGYALPDEEKAVVSDMALKGAYASAFKRAASTWGIGRYLAEYQPRYCELDPQGDGFLAPPSLPLQLLPAGDPGADEASVREAASKKLPPANAPVVQSSGRVSDEGISTKAKEKPKAVSKAPAPEAAEAAADNSATAQQAAVVADASPVVDSSQAGEISTPEQLLQATPAAEQAYVQQMLNYIDSKQNVPVVISTLEHGRGLARLKAYPQVLAYLLRRAKEAASETIAA